MSSQAELGRGRPVRLATANVAAAPTDGVDATHLIMSPRTPTQMLSTGVFLGLKAPTDVTAATAVAAGFTLTVWVANPVTFAWFAMQAITGLAYSQAYVTFDLDASCLYFQIAAATVSVAGSIDFHVWEQ